MWSGVLKIYTHWVNVKSIVILNMLVFILDIKSIYGNHKTKSSLMLKIWNKNIVRFKSFGCKIFYYFILSDVDKYYNIRKFLFKLNRMCWWKEDTNDISWACMWANKILSNPGLQTWAQNASRNLVIGISATGIFTVVNFAVRKCRRKVSYS